ncbi:MAG: PD40 domain-containing protein [Actinobacteria bacterium]|nr:PD40 domain-containing protein [Actinomycetota bacterium]
MMLAISMVSLLGVPAAAAPGDITACSTDSVGTFGTANSGWWFLIPTASSISLDGRYVAFDSYAINLVAGDTNGVADVFRKDLLTQEVVRCSTNAAGGQVTGGDSIWPSISADGRYVAFQSAATDIVGASTALRAHIYRKDLLTGAIERCSLGLASAEADNLSSVASMTPDGRYVAFESLATNLVPGDTNGFYDIFRFDVSTTTTERCSTNATGGQATVGDSMLPSINASGRYVAFRSGSTDIMAGITPGRTHVYRKDVTTNAIQLCSNSAAGTEADANSNLPSISGEGRFVAFQSSATNLVTGDTNGFIDIFRKDLLTNDIVRCSLSAAGAQTDNSSGVPSISADGRFVAFHSIATNLVTADTNGFRDIFRKDLLTGDVVLCSTSAAAVQSNNDSNLPSLSPDGKYVTFESLANNLTAGATGGFTNVYRKELEVTYPNWYLAEGTTAWGFSAYITIENPNTTGVTVDITYMTNTGSTAGPSLILPPQSQTTVDPNLTVPNQDFSTAVFCREGLTIAVDRTMTWTGTGAASPEGHNSVGVTSPDTAWYLPEGSSEWGFECWLLIQNPNNVDATCQVTYMREGAAAVTLPKTVPANSRRTYNMETDIGRFDSSIRVTSDYPVIPERAMYRNNRREGHDSIGTTQTAVDYYLAEGTTAWGFTNYVLVQNPQDTATDVTITYMTPVGPVPQPAFTMPANSRETIRVDDIPAVSNTDLSTQVHGSQPIIAVRAMYWDNGTGEACHDSIGMPRPHTTFYLPDGQTSEGRETWTLIQNPNSTPVAVEVSYLSPSGVAPVVFFDNVPANSRKTYNMVDNGISGRAAVMVRSLTPNNKIMVERAMYWDSRGAGTDTIGGYSD